MRIDKDPAKERANLRKHGLDFSLAKAVFSDPLSMTTHDRFENGEHRWRSFGTVGNTVLIVIHTYPSPRDENWIRVISMRKASAHERQNYEQCGYQ